MEELLVNECVIALLKAFEMRLFGTMMKMLSKLVLFPEVAAQLCVSSGLVSEK